MNLYQELGLQPVINANATLTRLGGSLMPPEVVAAMNDAAGSFVDLDEFQRRVGERLAELTHNEAALVCTGAAAGLVLATAACVTGDDPGAIAQLPNLAGLKDEVIIHRSHRNGYDHAVRQVGVKLVEIGYAMQTEPWELEQAITSQTAAVFWFQAQMTGHGDLPLATVFEIAAGNNASGNNVPVIVDAAAQVPPTENLWRFTEMGAALAIFSGGKDLRGPQASGLMVGRADLIEACRRNASPNHSIGRPMKVGKEETAGLLAAVERYLTIDQDERAARDEDTVSAWNEELNALPGVHAQRDFPNEAGQPLPRTLVTLDPARAGHLRDEVVAALWDGTPRISVAEAGDDGLFLNPMTLEDGEAEIVLARLMDVLAV